MSGPRIRVDIRAPVARLEHDRTVHPVSVRYRGRDYSARVTFALVNDEVPFGVGECSDEAFQAIVAALEHVGRPKLRQLLRACSGARKEA